MTGATREAVGFYEVAFNRNVDNCTWVATGGRAAGAGGTPPYIAATRPPLGGANEVGVVIFDAAGVQVDGASIFLSVLSPETNDRYRCQRRGRSSLRPSVALPKDLAHV